MRVLSLDLKNIGPFDEAHIKFQTKSPAVTFITGENGTGKSIAVDAIRALFGQVIGSIERPIWRDGVPFVASMLIREGDDPAQRMIAGAPGGAPTVGYFFGPGRLPNYHHNLIERLAAVQQGTKGNHIVCPNWVLDYWRSSIATDAYEITTLVTPDPRTYLNGALSGKVRNAAVTEALCFFDYLRGSSEPDEKRTGEALFDTTLKIIKASLLEGQFLRIDRRTLTPIVEQSGHKVPLRNLSSGNAYLIQRLIGLLVKMYAVHTIRQTPPDTLCDSPGLLLIDEAENHLHPRWQKRLIPDILSIFPNLQIIATTHSPHLLASVEGSRVYVCRYEQELRTCVIEDASGDFASQPVDQILVSSAFDHTQPFSALITTLLEARKRAIEAGDEAQRRQVEARLLTENPEYFSYFQIDEQLRMLAGGTQ